MFTFLYLVVCFEEIHLKLFKLDCFSSCYCTKCANKQYRRSISFPRFPIFRIVGLRFTTVVGSEFCRVNRFRLLEHWNIPIFVYIPNISHPGITRELLTSALRSNFLCGLHLSYQIPSSSITYIKSYITCLNNFNIQTVWMCMMT